MAAAQKKNTYTAAEVAELQTTIRQQQAEIDNLKKKLDHRMRSFSTLSVPVSDSPARKRPMF